jgi:putative ABC transport system ATP-binding protein
MIVAKGLTRVYRLGACEVVGISNIDLEIPKGAMVLLKGISGSGKSTLLSLLAGLDQPTLGDLTVAGHDLHKASMKQLTLYRREVVGMVFQSFNLLPTLSVLENVCLPALLAARPSGAVTEKAQDLLSWLGIDHRCDHLPAQLSGGEMQRTAIARALINDPSIILADEPTGNLDSRNGEKVIELLNELNQNSGRTIIIATHSSIADACATLTISLKDGIVKELRCAT